MKNRLSIVGGSACFVIVLIIAGCENADEAFVSGRVTLDGNALDCGTVMFVAGSKTDAKAAAGAIEPDGSYRVQIGQSGKLWIGEYAVRITAREPSTPHPEGGPPDPGALITPQRYASTSTSGLRYNIRSGDNVIDIALVSDPVKTTEEDASSSKEPEQASADKPAEGSAEKAERGSAGKPVEEVPAGTVEEAAPPGVEEDAE